MLVLDQFSSHKASDLLNQPTIELTFTIFLFMQLLLSILFTKSIISIIKNTLFQYIKSISLSQVSEPSFYLLEYKNELQIYKLRNKNRLYLYFSSNETISKVSTVRQATYFHVYSLPFFWFIFCVALLSNVRKSNRSVFMLLLKRLSMFFLYKLIEACLFLETVIYMLTYWAQIIAQFLLILTLISPQEIYSKTKSLCVGVIIFTTLVHYYT